MSLPSSNDRGSHHHPHCSHHHRHSSQSSNEEAKIIHAEDGNEESSVRCRPYHEYEIEELHHVEDEEEHELEDSPEAPVRPKRGKSFSKVFPDIPALEFDCEGDVLDRSKPKLRVRVVTWNIAGKHPKEDLTNLLGLISEKDTSDAEFSESAQSHRSNETDGNKVSRQAVAEADLILIGFQELSANPVAPVMETVAMSEIWSTTLKRRLSRQRYVLLQSIRLQGMMLLAFCKSKHLRHVRNLETAYIRLGASGWWGNKGAVGLSFEVYGVTICAVNSHLSAHDHAFEDRVKNHRQILADLIFPSRYDINTILDHDYAIWLGDFNFRVEGITQDKALYYIKTEQYPKLLKHDQLRRAAYIKGAFSTFKEGRIRFSPTYKFVEGRRNVYDMRNPAKIRRPSYCDRILWRGRDESQKVHLEEYVSHMEYRISDHKPVSAVMEISLGEEKDQYIVFDPIDRWFIGEHGHFRYSAKPGHFYSSWDWIGLYKVNHASFNDYLTYIWSPGAATENFGNINGRYITKTGRFLLIYFSSEHKCGIGFSEPFEIRGSA